MIRPLTAAAAEAFAAFRIASLRESPLSFGATAAHEEALAPEDWRKKLSAERAVVDGSFDASGRLVGTIGVYTTEDGSEASGPWLWAMYVAPECRGRGVGRQLVRHSINALRSQGEHRPLRLRVTHASDAARRLYLSLGFVPYKQESGVPWHSGQTVDLEYMSLGAVPKPSRDSRSP